MVYDHFVELQVYEQQKAMFLVTFHFHVYDWQIFIMALLFFTKSFVDYWTASKLISFFINVKDENFTVYSDDYDSCRKSAWFSIAGTGDGTLKTCDPTGFNAQQMMYYARSDGLHIISYDLENLLSQKL